MALIVLNSPCAESGWVRKPRHCGRESPCWPVARLFFSAILLKTQSCLHGVSLAVLLEQEQVSCRLRRDGTHKQGFRFSPRWLFSLPVIALPVRLFSTLPEPHEPLHGSRHKELSGSFHRLNRLGSSALGGESAGFLARHRRRNGFHAWPFSPRAASMIACQSTPPRGPGYRWRRASRSASLAQRVAFLSPLA